MGQVSLPNLTHAPRRHKRKNLTAARFRGLLPYQICPKELILFDWYASALTGPPAPPFARRRNCQGMVGLWWTTTGPRRECLIVRNGCVLGMNAFFRTRVVWWSVILLVALALDARAAEPKKRVLMLHAFNYTFPATSGRGRRTKAAARAFDNSRDRRRISRPGAQHRPAHETRAATFIRDKYGRHPPDLVMTLGSAALPFIVKHRDSPPQNPGRFYVNFAADLRRVPPSADVTGIVTEFNLAKTLSLAERLQPEARRLVIVAGSGETDRRWQPVARKMVEDRERKFETTYLFELPYQSSSPNCRRCPATRSSSS